MHTSAAILAALVVFSDASHAQARAPKQLGSVTGELAEPFTGPLRFVELRGGKVLVSDAGERRIVIGDFASDEITSVSREGGGPTEFRSATALLRAPGDSIWLYDLVAQRVLVFTPEGTPVRTQRFANAGDPMAMMNNPMVREHDAAGRAYGVVRAMSFTEGRMVFADSSVLVRLHAGRVDTLGKMPTFVRAPVITGGKVTSRAPGFVANDAWGVFRDGRVLRVHGERYVPELLLPDGTRRAASAIPFPSVPVTQAAKDSMMTEVRRAAEAGVQRMRAMAGNQPMPEFEILPPEQWQTHMPPLAGTVILVDSRNRAWVPVLRRAGDAGERFDLLDSDGRLLDSVVMPRGITLIGFGDGVLYATRTDADDLLWIQRHALP